MPPEWPSLKEVFDIPEGRFAVFQWSNEKWILGWCSNRKVRPEFLRVFSSRDDAIASVDNKNSGVSEWDLRIIPLCDPEHGSWWYDTC